MSKERGIRCSLEDFPAFQTGKLGAPQRITRRRAKLVAAKNVVIVIGPKWSMFLAPFTGSHFDRG